MRRLAATSIDGLVHGGVHDVIARAAGSIATAIARRAAGANAAFEKGEPAPKPK